MSIRYKVKVINSPNGLAIKDIPSLSASSIGMLSNNTELIVNNIKTAQDNSIWFQTEDTNKWILYQNKGTITVKLLKNVIYETQENDSQDSDTQAIIKPTPTTKYEPPKIESSINTQQSSNIGNTNILGQSSAIADVVGSTSSNVIDAVGTGESKDYVVIGLHRTDTLQQNSQNYPPKKSTNSNGEFIYDYSIDSSFLRASIKTIKVNMNIPSAFDRNDLNSLMNEAFNRYDIVYPDYMSHGLRGVVFFTRPDLWLLDEDKNFLPQVENDPQLYYISKTNPKVLKQLTLDYTASHEFIPLLCNTCQSMDIGDESVEVFDNIGETWVGNKMQYARNSIRSMVAGTFTCKFKESYDLAVTHMMQGWCSYESSVYIGTMFPRTEYIGDKILDYACDAYIFLIDGDGTIRYYTKYYGVFPISVNKSIYSYDKGSPIHFPEQNITFAYMIREDLNPLTIVDFNKHSCLDFSYKLDYEPKLGHSGTTWSGPPFVESIQSNGVEIFKLRYRANTKIKR